MRCRRPTRHGVDRRPARRRRCAFLKPIGIDSPEASWRWTWLSVVRAPIAPQVTASAMYCGLIGSRNSQPAGRPRAEHVEQAAARARRSPSVDVEAAVQAGIVDQALPAHRGARLLEVDPHDDQGSSASGATVAARPLRVVEGGRRVVDGARDRRPPAAGRPRRQIFPPPCVLHAPAPALSRSGPIPTGRPSAALLLAASAACGAAGSPRVVAGVGSGGPARDSAGVRAHTLGSSRSTRHSRAQRSVIARRRARSAACP